MEDSAAPAAEPEPQYDAMEAARAAHHAAYDAAEEERARQEAADADAGGDVDDNDVGFIQTECQGWFRLPAPVDMAKLAAEEGLSMGKTGRVVVQYKGETIRHQVCLDGKVVVRAYTLGQAIRTIKTMAPVYERCLGAAPEPKQKRGRKV